jgi:alpha-tubulin suppressor-like RCC1 family protein
VLTTEGKVFAWGKIPSFKSEKNSKIVSRKQRTPMHIVKLENIIDVFVGTSSLFALSADGSWWVYGSNEDAKLGLDDVCPIGWQKITKLTKRNVRKIRSSRMGSFAICFDD